LSESEKNYLVSELGCFLFFTQPNCFDWLYRIVGYLFAIVSLFKSPDFSRETYISENALQPASTNCYYELNDYQFSVKITREYINFQKSLPKNLPNEEWSKFVFCFLFVSIYFIRLYIYRVSDIANQIKSNQIYQIKSNQITDLLV
jgi:hypothetical protein